MNNTATASDNDDDDEQFVSDVPTTLVGVTRSTNATTCRPPSRRNDDDDTKPPPLSGARRPKSTTKQQLQQQQTVHINHDGPHFYPDKTELYANTRKTSSSSSVSWKDTNRNGPEFSPNTRVEERTEAVGERKFIIPKGDVKQQCSYANVTRLQASGSDEKRTEITNYSGGSGGVVPGAFSVSKSSPNNKSLKEIDPPELFPDDAAPDQVPIDDDRKPQAKSSTKKMKAAGEGKNVSDEPSMVDSGSTAGHGRTTPDVATVPENQSRPTFQPRAPQDEIVIGAIPVPGIDGPGSDDLNDELTEVMSTSGTEDRSGLPVARIADDTNPDRLEDLGEAEPISDHDLKGRGVMGWIRRHKFCTAVAVFVVLVAIVGGTVGATLGGGSSPSSQSPSFAPTISPTAAPTLLGFEEVVDSITTITPHAIVTDPSTPQSEAVRWLLRDDEYNVDFDDTSKLLQRYALATVYFATVGPNWTRQLQFLSNQDECSWTEVVENITFGIKECNSEGLATTLRLSQNGLRGTLPEEIRALSMLVEFRAADNSMSGTIPTGITALTELSDISLFQCGVSGTLPQDIGNLSKLTHLSLSSNSLTGTLPLSLYELTALENLDLTDNELSGTLLTNIGNLVSLRSFFLEANNFSGMIPSDVSRMTSLEYIFLSANDFTGGMENFCTGSIDFRSFESDCFVDGTFVLEPEVECSCCSVCCSQESFEGCVPIQILP